MSNTDTPVSITDAVPGPIPVAVPAAAPPPGRDLARLRRRTLVHSLQVLLVVGFIGLWQYGADHGNIDVFTFGKPSGVWDTLHTWFTKGTSVGSIWENLSITMQETVYGFLIGTGAGVVLGVLLGRIRFLADVFGPFIKVFNSIPRIILGSIFMIWFGLAMSGKVALAVVLVFFAVFFNAFQGTREVDGNLINNARILGASPLQVTRQVVIPSAMTWIIASMHSAFGFALIGAIVGELLGAQRGIGLLIQEGQGTFNPDAVYAGTVLVAVMALIAEFVITRIERRLLSWRPRQSGAAEL